MTARVVGTAPLIESVHAVVLVGDRYALQLRDDKPGIAGPGLWGLFGGTLRQGEPPEQGLRRELVEELAIEVGPARLFWRVDGSSEFSPTPKRWWFFEVDATMTWNHHRLGEGQAAALFAFEDIAALAMTPMTRSVLARHHGLPATVAHDSRGARPTISDFPREGDVGRGETKEA